MEANREVSPVEPHTEYSRGRVRCVDCGMSLPGGAGPRCPQCHEGE